MRRANALWFFNSTTSQYADLTAPLGSGQTPVVLAPNDRLYIGATEWLQGVLLFIQKAIPGTPPTIAVDVLDGADDSWLPLTLADRTDNLETDYAIVSPGYQFNATGVAEWQTTEALWTERLFTPGFPEAATPPPLRASLQPRGLFWVRLHNVGSTAVQFDRVLPVLYNTYVDAAYVAHYAGVDDPTDLERPLLSALKEQIHTQEDELDTFLRYSFRIRQTLNERDVFNAYGQKCVWWPVIAVTRLGLWSGTDFMPLTQGRNQDYYVDTAHGQIFYTRTSLGRGLPWSYAASRYLRQPMGAEWDYVHGGDFDLTPYRGAIRDIVTMRVCAELATMQDWVVYFMNNPDAMPKPEKVREWRGRANEIADQIRGMALV